MLSLEMKQQTVMSTTPRRMPEFFALAHNINMCEIHGYANIPAPIAQLISVMMEERTLPFSIGPKVRYTQLFFLVSSNSSVSVTLLIWESLLLIIIKTHYIITCRFN